MKQIFFSVIDWKSHFKGAFEAADFFVSVANMHAKSVVKLINVGEQKIYFTFRSDVYLSFDYQIQQVASFFLHMGCEAFTIQFETEQSSGVVYEVWEGGHDADFTPVEDRLLLTTPSLEEAEKCFYKRDEIDRWVIKLSHDGGDRVM